MTQRFLLSLINALLFLVWTCVLLVPYAVCLALHLPLRQSIQQLYFEGCLGFVGIRVLMRGTPAEGAVLFTANHVSYLDIPILGILIDTVFIAKSDVARWPVFGLLAKLARTQFIERKVRQTASQSRALAKRLENGERLVLFPEGTSTDGTMVKPFHSGLLSAAEINVDQTQSNIRVQPVTIVYKENEDGRPLTADQRDGFAWYGDMTLLPHLWRAFGSAGCIVEVVFHAPLPMNKQRDRKAMALASERAVRSTLQAALPGKKVYLDREPLKPEHKQVA